MLYYFIQDPAFSFHYCKNPTVLFFHFVILYNFLNLFFLLKLNYFIFLIFFHQQLFFKTNINEPVFITIKVTYKYPVILKKKIESCNEILSLISEDIKKWDTNYRKVISLKNVLPLHYGKKN